MEILIGADPEIFVTKGGEFHSGHELIPGTKRSPFFVEAGAVQVDGVALEFNILPAKSEDEFVENIEVVMMQLRDMVPEEYDFAIVPTAMFDRDYFDSLPEEPKLLGCEPDFNAYTGKVNKKPSTDLPMRTGAGHVHIGWTKGASPESKAHMAICMEIVRRLDETLLSASMEWDSDETRRSLYGSKGSFRPKHFGVEYRPLSNAWLRSPELMRRVYQITTETVRDYFDTKEIKASLAA